MQFSLDLGSVPYNLPEYVSPSSLSTFQQCPLKYKFSRLDKLPSEPTEAQVLGSFVHEILEELFGYDPNDRTLTVARAVARKLWSDKWNAEFDQLKVKSSVNDFRWQSWWCVENYFAMEDPTIFQPNGIEVKVDGIIGGAPVLGIVDRWHLEDNGIVVSDYKTGKKPNAKYEWEKKLQITMYCILLSEQTGFDINRAELLYLKSARYATYEISNELIDTVTENVSETWVQIGKMCESGVFDTKVGPLCNWCDYKNICPAWVKND